MPTAVASSHLLFRLGAHVCALPLAHVIETMRPLPVEPIAGAPPFVLGVAVVRGASTPVLDACGLAGVTRSHTARFVTVEASQARAALAVDEVVGVQLLDPSSLAPLPLDRAGVGGLAPGLRHVLEAVRILPVDQP